MRADSDTAQYASNLTTDSNRVLHGFNPRVHTDERVRIYKIVQQR